MNSLNWVDGDGKNHSRVKIVAEHVEFRPEFKNRKEEVQSAEMVAEKTA